MRDSCLRLVVGLTLFSAALGAQGPSPDGRGRGGPGRGGSPFDDLRGPVIAGAPFRGVQSTNFQHTLANGNHIVRQEHATIYRDSSGRVRVERTVSRPADATEHEVISILDPVAGYAFRLDPATKTATQTRIGGPEGRGDGGHGGRGRGDGTRHDGPPPASARAQRQDLGTKTVSGVVAAGTRTTETIPAGAVGNEQPILVVRETWFSNDLKMPVIVSVADPLAGDSVVQFSDIVLGEPDASLFQVPAGYSISSGRHGGPPRGR